MQTRMECRASTWLILITLFVTVAVMAAPVSAQPKPNNAVAMVGACAGRQ